MATINQPTQNPTNKLSSAVLATAFVAVAKVVAGQLWPDVELGDDVWIAVMPVVAYVAGFIIKDAPNVVVTQEVVATDVIMPDQSDA